MTPSIPIVPILIGVTGHRDIVPQDIEKLKEAVGAELDRIRSMCQGYGGTAPIVLISGLAEGADRLAAQVALDRGIQLLAVLPMPQPEYEKDFRKDESIAEFRALLKRATQVIDLPILDAQQQPTTLPSDVDRKLQYEQLGLFIASNCHLLIALWDGVDLPKRGGTSNIVGMRKGNPGKANPTVLFFRSALPIGYGIQIVTPRLSQSGVTGEPYTSISIIPDSWKSGARADDAATEAHAQEVLGKIISNTLELNADIAQHVADLTPLEGEETKDSAGQHPECGRVLGALANRFKTHRVRAITALFALIVVAFVWFELHIKVFPQIAGLPLYLPFSGYLILIGLIEYVYARAKHRRFYEKHQDYRVLAEALRVQSMWRTAGITGIEGSAADHCVPRQVGELSWIRLALFGLTYSQLFHATATEPDIERVRIQWIEGQSSFYNSRHITQSLAVKRAEFLGGLLLIACACLALVLCIPLLSPNFAKDGWQLWTSRGFMILTALMLAIAAARHGFVEKMAWAEQAHQYDRMRNVFDLANKTLLQMGDQGTLKDKQQVLLRLGDEALTEHSDWLIMHRARPLEVPRL